MTTTNVNALTSTDRTAFRDAAERILGRARNTASTVQGGFPHWASATTGRWTTTPDGDWTGGALPGMLWLGLHLTGDAETGRLALEWCERLRPRAKLETAFKGFGFYYGAALGQMFAKDSVAGVVALEAAESLHRQFDSRLGLIPLGKDAEEANEVGKVFSSIDSLQATPLLFWASSVTGDRSYAERAVSHTTRVLDIHCRPDGSIIQSSELDAHSGKVTRYFTHKGWSDTSIWGRAQAWGMVYGACGFARDPSRTRWLDQSMAAADWWISRVPEDMVAYWDFNDPAIPNTNRDTAATSIVCAALLKLAELAPDQARRERYRDTAVRTARGLVHRYVTPVGSDDGRPAGMLVGGCFNKRPDSRAQDSATDCELIFGDYYLLESLLVLTGTLKAIDL